MANGTNRKTTAGATRDSVSAGMGLEEMRAMFKKPPKPPLERPATLRQPTVADSRGTLVKVRADKEHKGVKQELWEVAQDLGWPEDVNLQESHPRRGRTSRPDGWLISDGKGARGSVIIISSDAVGITYCVPPHPSFQDDDGVQRFVGMDFGGKDGDFTAVTIAKHEDGTLVAEDVIQEKAKEIATAMGTSVSEAGRAIKAAMGSFGGAVASAAEFEKSMAAIRKMGGFGGKSR